MYGTEACLLNKSDLSSFDFVINRLFMKLFKTNNIEIVELRQYQFGFEHKLNNRSRVSCAHNTLRESVCINITP